MFKKVVIILLLLFFLISCKSERRLYVLESNESGLIYLRDNKTLICFSLDSSILSYLRLRDESKNIYSKIFNTQISSYERISSESFKEREAFLTNFINAAECDDEFTSYLKYKSELKRSDFIASLKKYSLSFDEESLFNSFKKDTKYLKCDLKSLIRVNKELDENIRYISLYLEYVF